jgi:hypothetical protein
VEKVDDFALKYEIPEDSLLWGEDNQAVAILLEVSRPDIVFFQALFESYEGVGTVRTMNQERSILAILTTVSMAKSALQLLRNLSTGQEDLSGWRFASGISKEDKASYRQFL